MSKRINERETGGIIRFEDDPSLGHNAAPGKVHVPYQACYYKHPALELGGGKIIGGNCSDHTHHGGADLYVALDAAMKHPFYDPETPPALCVHYPIRNMDIPKDVPKFVQFIDMIAGYLKSGKTVHIGCIGGHGRTGMVIAAVASRVLPLPDNDHIGWVRTNYCVKAVETAGQENFLVVNFGCKPPARKPGLTNSKSGFSF